MQVVGFSKTMCVFHSLYGQRFMTHRPGPSKQSAIKALWLFELSEFHRARRLREAQGSPKGPGARAVSFGYFSCPHKKSNINQW
jgi:hypothetical protein